MQETPKLDSIVLPAKGANVRIKELGAGKRHITIERTNPDLFVRFTDCVTSYPVDLIALVLNVTGAGYLCDEIARDESKEYTGAALKWTLLSYLDPDAFSGSRILDFGCGSGASTSNLARMFPSAEIVGIELEGKLLEVAEARARFYKHSNVQFYPSPGGDTLPPSMGTFNHIVMTGVYEHLLPRERSNLLPKLWSLLERGGVLFLHETPHRYFPIETHTTGGLPLVNYLPDRLAHRFALRFSRKKLQAVSWDTLLRAGIRGGTIREIDAILKNSGAKPTLLRPSRLGVKDRIDLWYRSSPKSRHQTAKKSIWGMSKALKSLTGLELVPYLELALQKNER